MANDPIRIDQHGSIRPHTPKAIDAMGKAREGFARVVVGGVVLGGLTLAYIVGLFMRVPDVHNILVVVGSGVGFLLGRSSRGAGEE
jgi:hypothetical protein